MAVNEVLTVTEAAEVLGVSRQRVRQMIGAGHLVAHRSSAGWLISSSAVATRVDNIRNGRPVEARTAWLAIAALSAGSAHRFESGPLLPARDNGWAVDRRLRHRVMRMLAALPDPADDAAPWRRLLAARGQSRQLWVHPGVLGRLLADRRVSRSGDAAAHPTEDGLAGGDDRAQIYVRHPDVEAVLRQYRLRDDPEGAVALFAIPQDVAEWLAPGHGRSVAPAAAAADLLEEDDVRARNAAVRQLRVMWRDHLATTTGGGRR